MHPFTLDPSPLTLSQASIARVRSVGQLQRMPTSGGCACACMRMFAPSVMIVWLVSSACPPAVRVCVCMHAHVCPCVMIDWPTDQTPNFTRHPSHATTAHTFNFHPSHRRSPSTPSTPSPHLSPPRLSPFHTFHLPTPFTLHTFHLSTPSTLHTVTLPQGTGRHGSYRRRRAGCRRSDDP